MSKLDILDSFTPDEIMQHFKRNGITVLVFNGLYKWTTTINEGLMPIRYETGRTKDIQMLKVRPRTISIEMAEIQE